MNSKFVLNRLSDLDFINGTTGEILSEARDFIERCDEENKSLKQINTELKVSVKKLKKKVADLKKKK